MKKNGIKPLMNMFAVIVLLHLILLQRAYAYIDPGTGSIIIQVLIGALVGGLFAVKKYWKRINLFLKNLFSGSKHGETGE